jgi:hypothetical protein
VMGAAGVVGTPTSPPATGATGVDALLEQAPRPVVIKDTPERLPVRIRLKQLASAIDNTRKGRSNLDVRKWMNALGMLAIGFGIATIILGWYGASHSAYLQQEVPYLISGGLLGLALVFAGGVLVLASWHLRSVQEANRNAQGVARAIGRLEQVMRASMNGPFNGNLGTESDPSSSASSVPSSPGAP